MYGLADSPVALAAWMINHDAGSYQDIADAARTLGVRPGTPAGHPTTGRESS
jgi:hypothetical protein